MSFLLVSLWFFNLIVQEIHAPILLLWGVKVVVLALFAGFALAGIVSCPSHLCNFFLSELIESVI